MVAELDGLNIPSHNTKHNAPRPPNTLVRRARWARECTFPAAVPRTPRRLRRRPRTYVLWYAVPLHVMFFKFLIIALDGYNTASSNRTAFPLSGGFYSLNSEHPRWTGKRPRWCEKGLFLMWVAY